MPDVRTVRVDYIVEQTYPADIRYRPDQEALVGKAPHALWRMHYGWIVGDHSDAFTHVMLYMSGSGASNYFPREPIRIRKIIGGEAVINGQHRVLAAWLLGIDEIEVEYV